MGFAEARVGSIDPRRHITRTQSGARGASAERALRHERGLLEVGLSETADGITILVGRGARMFRRNLELQDGG